MSNLAVALTIKANSNQAVAGIQRVSKALGGLRESMKAIDAAKVAAAGAAITGLGAGIAFGLKGALEASATIADQVHRLANVVPAGAAGLRELAMAQKAAAQYSTQHAISQEQVLKQIYLGKSAGFDMATSIYAMNKAAALAIGLQGDMEGTQRALNLAFLDFKDPTKTARQNLTSLADTMAKTVSAFDYKNIEEFREQLMLAAPTAQAAGMATLEGFKKMSVILADFTRHGLTGSMGGAAFEESLHGIINMEKNLGIQMARNKQGGMDFYGSIENLRRGLATRFGVIIPKVDWHKGMSPAEEKKVFDQATIAMQQSLSRLPPAMLQAVQKTFGIRGIRALLLNPTEMDYMLSQLRGAGGAAEQFQRSMESAPNQQWTILTNKLFELKKLLGDQLMPTAMRVASAFGALVSRVTAFAKAHPALVKFTAMLTAMGAVTALIAGPLVTLGAGIALLGIPLATAATAIGAFIAAVAGIAGVGAAFAAVPGAARAAWNGLKAAWSGAKALFSAIFSPIKNALAGAFGGLWDSIKNLGAAFRPMLTWLRPVLPVIEAIGKAVAIIAGVALAAPFVAAAGAVYLVIRAITAVINAVAWVVNAFKKLPKLIEGIDWMHAGIEIAKAIGRGIESALGYPIHAIGHLASRVRGYLPFSPAKEGPLRDLHRTSISHQIASAIKPGPVVSSMRKLATAAAAAAAITATVAVKPVFSSEGPRYYRQAYKLNAPYAVPGPYMTHLPPMQEKQFRAWVRQKHVPFNPNDKIADYDMRGFWQAMKAGKVAQWKGPGSHFPDTFKTPYDTTFSAESKYAIPGTPRVWRGDNLIDPRTGRLIFAPPKTETPVPMLQPSKRGGDSFTINFNPHIEIKVDGAADPEEIARQVRIAIRNSGRDLHDVLVKEQGRRSRSEFF